MQPSSIDFGSRAQLTELMDAPCSREDLRACLHDISRLNRWFLAHRPVLHWLNSLSLPHHSSPLHIVDVGCGYGDGLRRIEQWAKDRDIAVDLTGIDLNPDAVAIAADASPRTSDINWLGIDVFSYAPRREVDIVISSQFTHHLQESEIVQFLRWMESNAQVGWFISDLSRNAVPYQIIKVFSRFIGLHPFVQNDSPVSIARAFVPGDWQKMCEAAGLNESDVSIRGFSPARLCVGRRKSQ